MRLRASFHHCERSTDHAWRLPLHELQAQNRQRIRNFRLLRQSCSSRANGRDERLCVSPCSARPRSRTPLLFGLWHHALLVRISPSREDRHRRWLLRRWRASRAHVLGHREKEGSLGFPSSALAGVPTVSAAPNHSIERTWQGPLRAPCPAAHVER